MSTPEVTPKLTDNVMSTTLYETDFYAWTQLQTRLLRHHQWQHLDLPNLMEEIESLGKQQQRELRSRLAILTGHLLKWEYQPQRRSRSWLATLKIQRLEIADLLEDSPSLKAYLEAAIQKAYLKAVTLAAAETGLPEESFPPTCPYDLAVLLDSKFYLATPAI
ncbi:MAG: DUF29 domain-containing protein [Leptolyngbya sp. SIO4C1]|nr:DUF29 domain-containing protein [Leptolyngbya sp. SIO4C1]